MDVREIGADFARLIAENRSGEAETLYWADDVRSVEAMDSPMADLTGREAVKQKHAWWEANHEIHGVEVEGPFVNGEQFALRFTVDVTPKDGERHAISEVALYTVRDGRIVEERFFY